MAKASNPLPKLPDEKAQIIRRIPPAITSRPTDIMTDNPVKRGAAIAARPRMMVMMPNNFIRRPTVAAFMAVVADSW
jgi:hypothetical protein